VLRFFLETVRGTRFVEKLTPETGSHLFIFERQDSQRFAIAYCEEGSREIEAPFPLHAMRTALGEEIEPSGDKITLTGRPLYLDDARNGK